MSFSQIDMFNAFEAVYLEGPISYIKSRGPFESLSDLVNLLEDTTCELLKKLPLAFPLQGKDVTGIHQIQLARK